MIKRDGSLDLTRVESLCKKYNYKHKVIGNTILINSYLDEWYAEVLDQNLVMLYHKNKTKKKNKHHKQRNYRDFEFMFESIRKHDAWKLNKDYNKFKRIDDLFKQVSKK